MYKYFLKGVIMNILVALDSNYIYPLCVMLHSLALSDKESSFDIYVAYSSLTEQDFDEMEKALSGADARIHRVFVDNKIFEGAPVLDRISKETYYRLLIGDILPADVHRILYLDPDIVINKSLEDFYNMNLNGNIIAGGTHLFTIMKKVNHLRLGLTDNQCYINAGVLLIDLDAWRDFISLDMIFDFISKNSKKLFLADQDVINSLFREKIVHADERIYNIDEKTFSVYSLPFAGKKRINADWVRNNSVIIHFNGRYKPWKEKKYRGNLGEYFEKFKQYK